MVKQQNSFQKGSIRYIVMKEDDVFYAVGLEFNLVIEGSTKEVALFNLFEAITGYIESAKKANLRPRVLNQKTDEEYEKLWNDLIAGNPVESPYKIFTFGRQLV
ncbi:MAG: hypothetical protein Q7R78_01060 [bacterium]|nr:hypothetical protein [bacterium]